jgi:hypothetical protein
MLKRKIFALALCLSVSGACLTGAFAQITVSAGMALSVVKDFAIDGETGEADDVKRTLTPENGWGGNLLIDYLLPVSVPLSLGFEVGVNNSAFKVTRTETALYTDEELGDYAEQVHNEWEDSMMAIPLLFRAAYHFDLLPKLDLYVVGKIGYVFGVWEGDYRDWEESWKSKIDPVGGLGFGFDVGAAYYFNAKLGIFVEAGFDSYMLKTRVTGKTEEGEVIDDITYSAINWDYVIDAPFSRIVTFGFSAKL